ncbi:zona pellucida sperm-binding protein 2-like isoform X2 [Acipenser ruthenus]|uniref:zona pellucida sperm-binding protein 2-like isoform X2 n=1 Tax=Acipenser ruthenus TaxID=7906 RepID=UPI002742068A|nr:zona pellucida sperm-binding protein 2-like isoform X2 [Acipenser ruthenus]
MLFGHSAWLRDKMAVTLVLQIALLCATFLVGVTADAPPGTFVTECRDRYFWMLIKRSFIQDRYRFDIIDDKGVHPLNGRYAASCGFTSVFNIPGDLIFRASFLACHVLNQKDTRFHLQFLFVNIDQFGRETSYPFSMTCNLGSDWKPREIVCEENYMEVSVRKNVPVIAQEGLGTEDWQGALPIAQQAAMMVWQVVIHKSGQPAKSMNISTMQALGYMVNSTSSRVYLRSPFGMPESEVLLVAGIQVEAIRATVFYKQRWMLLLVDTSAACTKNNATFDGTRLIWEMPRIFTPLVLHVAQFQDKQITMGVEGILLNAPTLQTRGYNLSVNNTIVKISIPYGAEGGYLKSRVINNQYNQLYAIDLFLEHQWADDLWEVTQHRSFKPVNTPLIPETPYVINNTVPSEKGFTVTLGNFKPDVELKKLTINRVPLTLPEAQNRGVEIIKVQHPNGTNDFVLKVPFNNPLVSVEYIGGLIRRYTLNINYTLNIVPQNDPYFHPATIVCDVKDVSLPDVKSFCTETSIVFEVTPGNMDSNWELCIGNRSLPYTITEPKITIELPLFSIGYIYEDISLRGLTVRVELNMRNIKNLQVEKQFVQRCPIPTRKLLVCMPNGVITVVAVTMEPIPVVEPSKTTLLDRTCKPKEFDSTRALFTFSVNTCGTTSKIVNNYLVYENEVVYTRALFPPNAPVITRDSEYRLTIRCRYPLNDTLTLAAERKAVPAPAPYSGNGHGYLHLRSYDPMAKGNKRPRDVMNLKARIARDINYSQFYSTFPVSQSLLEPLFLQVELLHPYSLADHLILQDCWATLTPELDASPQWDLVTDSCLVTGDSYRTQFHPVLASTLTGTSSHLKRLEVQVQRSNKDPAFWRQVYFHCMAVVCDPNLEDTCNKTCVPGDRRSARSVDRFRKTHGYVSAGPVQMKPEGQVADIEAADYSPLPHSIPLVGVAAVFVSGLLLLVAVVLSVKS